MLRTAARALLTAVTLISVASLVAAGSAQAATPSGFSIVPVPNIPGGALKAVAATYDGGHTDVWAVGYQFTPTVGYAPLILRSTGGTWHRISLPWPVLANTELTDVTATAGAHPGVWITGWEDNDQVPLLVHWTPGSWTKTTPPSPDTWNSLGLVSSDSAGDVWAGGEAGPDDGCYCDYPYFDALSGGSWSHVPLIPLGTDEFWIPSAVQLVAPGDAWATVQMVAICCDGAAGGELWHYTAGAWHFLNLPVQSDYTTASDVVAPASSDSDVWVVGDDNEQAAMWHWNGSSVTEYDPWSYATSHTLTSVAARGPTDVWAVGARENDARTADRTLIVHWNGTSWTDLGGPNGPVGGSSLVNITVAPHTHAMWAVGTTGTSLSTDQPLILRHP